ncbi:HDIG domain-containing protein [Candidatus Gracilibacteria bacterium]|nr:HDIG domain-containing protein [Candidatus Gracilibacteria bacterium]
MKLPITREQAWKLVQKHNSHVADLSHYLESEAVMRGVARHLGEDEEYYGMLGLLHDIDWGITKDNDATHLTKAPDILRESGFDDAFIQAVVSHGYGFDCAGLKDCVRNESIQHALAASETVTGLIYAYALMRGGITGMEVKGLKKRFKSPAFAAKVNRDVIAECEKLGIPLDDFLQIAIDSIEKIKDQIGLK